MTVHSPIQADFRYDATRQNAIGRDEPGLSLSLSIFADRGHLRDAIREDALAVGLNIREAASLAVLLEGAARPLGDVVMLDCPEVDAATLAALVRLDMRAANSGARLIVSTTLDALDDVFGCMDMSDPLLLVNPGRGERLVALGQVFARRGQSRLRELSEEDRVMLLRLTEQVNRIAERVDRLGGGSAEASAFRFESPSRDFSGRGENGERLVRGARPPLPDPRLVRRIIRQRQLRARFFDGDLFADPAWDMTPKIFGNSNVFKEAA